MDDIRLVVKIENRDPMELFDLTKSLVALSTNFQRFASKYGDNIETKEAKLYVKEIRSGSVIVELWEVSTLGMITFADNINIILEFTKHIKNVLMFFLEGTGIDPQLSPVEFKELSAIINPVVKDKGSQINISNTINGDVYLSMNINHDQSTSIQSAFDSELKKLNTPSTSDQIEERVILTFYQARSDLNSKRGNRGTIESLYERPLNIIFDNNELQSEILQSEINPLNTSYLVDVKVEWVNEKPMFYRILKLHQYFTSD